ncbi:MAG: hypothetical protein K0R18_1005, partial [Bacillales bacterium]|nr:hypothetical protein [Bacillales bacterium]
ILFEVELKESKLKNFFGQTLEKRTTRAFKEVVDSLNKYANKHAGLYKAYNETKQIFTLDEHMSL